MGPTEGIRVRGLVVEVEQPGPTRRIVGPLDIHVAPGEILGLVGESGSGKTLTLRALAGYPPEGLRARSNDAPFPGIDSSAMVFQDPMDFFNPRWRISRSIGEVLRYVPGSNARDAGETTCRLLHDVGLTASDGRLYPFEMSGGMIQRASIAMALAVRPRVLLADEVTSALDPVTRDRILELLCRLGREQKVATVVVSHDLSSLMNIVERVVVLYQGQPVEEGNPHHVLSAGRHRYTDLLVRSRPGVQTRGTVLPEFPPAPADGSDDPAEGTGCPFVDRCPVSSRTCRDLNPAWSGDGVHRYRCHHPVPHAGEFRNDE